VQIRRANPEDAYQLAPLVLASAKRVLRLTFERSPEHTALGYLRQSLAMPDGQYGSHHHLVMVKQGHIVACVTAWHSHMTDAFHQGTLSSILEYYTASQLAEVITINQVLQTCISKVQDNELCIGHLSVLPDFRRQGIACQLIEHIVEHAKTLGKSQLGIDVEETNQPAIAFYQKLGFELTAKSPLTNDMQELGIVPFWHFSKSL
jgi:ribosomal protein S18 acetylase RimI-like enzyme